jgi:hypothetical protein
VFGDGHGEAYTAIVWVVGVSPEMAILRRPRPSMVSKATCAGPICEVLSLRRGLGPHHARREHVGTWETSLRPQPSSTVQGRDGKPRRRSRQGRCEESDGVVVPVKCPNKAGMTSGGGRGGKDPARKEREWTATASGLSAGLRLTQRGPRSRTGLLASSRELATLYFREEPGAGKPHAGICAGGGK